MNNIAEQVSVECIPHENGIHELIINDMTRQAVDMLFGHISRIHSEAQADETVRFLVVQNNNVSVPIRYSMSRVRALKSQWNNPSRSVTLLDMNPMMQTTIRVFETIRFTKNESRFMPPEKREDAILWLLEH